MPKKGKINEPVNSDSVLDNINDVLDNINDVLDSDSSPSNSFVLSHEQTSVDSQISIDAENEARARKSRILKQNEETEQERKKVYSEKNLIARAKALSLLGVNAIKYVHFIKPRQAKEKPIEIAVRPNPVSELNLMAAFDALYDYGSGIVSFPHMDTFSERLVDEFGEPLSNKNTKMRDLMMALNILGMDNPQASRVKSALMTWAIDHESDFIKDHFKKVMPVWDGIKRTEMQLINMFESLDTELSREFGHYFWLSLYNRLTHPGAYAPLALALIGGQLSGKSNLGLMICQTLMGNQLSKPVQLDLSLTDQLKFLRDITGRSIVANVGENIGVKRGEMDRIKEFVAKSADDVNQKFEDSTPKPRQWIIIMDGNNYDGLQRDETGNRRFYPQFVGQLPDENGQPAWKTEFTVNFDNFDNDLWQLMAECKSWMDEHDYKDYIEVVDSVSRKVMKFSAAERKLLRGTIKDSFIENNLIEMLSYCQMKRTTKGATEHGWFISTFEICQNFLNRKRKEPFYKGLKMYMEKLGFIQKQITLRGYFIPTEMNERELRLYILRNGMDKDKFTEEELRFFDDQCDIFMNRNSGQTF